MLDISWIWNKKVWFTIGSQLKEIILIDLRRKRLNEMRSVQIWATFGTQMGEWMESFSQGAVTFNTACSTAQKLMEGNLDSTQALKLRANTKTMSDADI